MGRQVSIDPISRIEGHAKITLFLDDSEEVSDAQFHVTQFRGFEKFCEGRPFHEMPSITARICGICPVSHLIASAKACDELLAVRIPPTAVKLRQVLNLAQLAQSHALSFFHLSSPDLLLGMDSDPAQRNVFGLLKSHPELARQGIRLRQFGQEIIEMLAGRKIHPAWTVAGGVNKPLSGDVRDQILCGIPDALEIACQTLQTFKGMVEPHRDLIESFGNFPSMFMGLVTEDGSLEHYDGKLRIIDAEGNKVVDQLDPARYDDVIGEAVEPWTYLKFPYYKPVGYPEGMYRVGPLARLNVADRCGTPLADEELAEFRQVEGGGGPVLGSFFFHYARLIELVYALERIEQLLNEPDILSDHVRAYAAPNAREGVGVSEAPRGTLIHHYKADEQGLMTWANLIVATGHNNLAMNKSVLQVAKRFVKGDQLTEGMLNRCEAVIRAFDPCLSCSTHALGQMPMKIELRGSDGRLLDELRRD